MRTIALILFLSLIFPTSVRADNVPTSATIDAVWNALSVFEGSKGTVTGDFDCQGMSIGVAQWNIGKSFASVKSIVLANPREKLLPLMPTFGSSFVTALYSGQNATMTFVRKLQRIEDPSSCDAKKRKASWNNDGKLFVSELKKLLVTTYSESKQRELRNGVYIQGWLNANNWASANRGAGAMPSLREIAYFVDMAIFNGGGLQKFGLKYKAPDPDIVAKLSSEALKYLETATDEFLLHKIAARNNAKVLKPEELSDNDRALFALSYEVALKLNASYSRQFRLTVINRRAAILFGEAFYSDNDSAPTRIEFKKLNHL